MSWETAQAPLIFFEGEDEAELINQFVWWRAHYPDYSIFAVCEHIFKELKDNDFRANQAALAWQKDLSITKRIDDAVNNGGDEPIKLTKEQLQGKIIATVESSLYTPQEKTARIKGLEAYAQNEGWVVKAIEKKTTDTTNRRPTVIIAQANAA